MIKGKTIVAKTITSLLVFLFMYTASDKLFSHEFFIAQMSRTPFTGNYASLISWVLPITELIIVALLLFEKTRKNGLIGSALLLCVFTIYLATMKFSGLHLPCSCAGLIQQLSWKGHILLNIVFIALSLFAIQLERKRKRQERNTNTKDFFIQ